MKTKTKITVAVVSVLSVVALAGTGYAGWVISKNAEGNKEGNVEVLPVKDNSVVLSEIKFSEGKENIVWGTKSKSNSATYNWLKSETDDKQEEFQPVLTFKVSNTDATDKTRPVVSGDIQVNDDSQGDYRKCKNANLIKGIDAGETGKSSFETTAFSYDVEDGTSNTYTVTLTIPQGLFGWGTHFDEKNPINYYNAHKAEDPIDSSKSANFSDSNFGAFKNPANVTYFDDAVKSMNAIHSLEGVKFVINLSVSHK